MRRRTACIGANINQLTKWANTHKRAAEAVEVLTALPGIERRIIEFTTPGMAEDGTEDESCS